MGRIFKKVLLGSGLAFAIFLAVIFLFGDENLISVNYPENSEIGSELALNNLNGRQNLTDKISDKLADQIIKDNPDGPLAEDEQITLTLKDPKTFIEQAVKADGEEFSSEDLIYVVEKKNILPASVDDKTTQIAYITEVAGILNKNIKTEFSTTAEKDGMLSALVAEREATIKALYKIAVPASLLDIHQDFLTILGTQRNIYTALIDYESDPLLALLAVKFESQVRADAELTIGKLNKFIESQNLNG
jgi:hypothetical protein